MLQLEKGAKDNLKIFLLNKKKSKLSFFNIKFDWNFLCHPYKSKNFKFKMQQKTINKKDADIRLDVHKILFFIKNHLQCVKIKKKTCNFM